MLLTAMTGVMLTCGSFSVYAEPDDTVSGGETSVLQESFAEVSASVPTENSVTEASPPQTDPQPSEQVTPYEPSEQVTPYEPSEQVTPYEPSEQITPYEPSEQITPYEPSRPSYEYQTEYSHEESTVYVPEPSHQEVSFRTEPHYEYHNEGEEDGNTTVSYVYENEVGQDEYVTESEEVYKEPEPDRDTSALEISDYEMSDTQTLTSQDWEDLKKGKQTSQLELKSNTTQQTNTAFSKLKEESKGGNDDWIFLAIGIGLIAAGLIAAGYVIYTVVKARKLRR